MEFGAAFPADAEALEVVEQGEGLLDDIPELALSTIKVFGSVGDLVMSQGPERGITHP